MTLKQEKWKRRSQIIWKLKGMHFPIFSDVLTTKECIILTKIQNLIYEFNSQTRQSSEELGFHTHKRCLVCGRIIPEDKEYCDRHN